MQLDQYDKNHSLSAMFSQIQKRKAAIANGLAPASFARYVRSHELIKIRRSVYTKEIGAIDDLFQLQRRYPKIVYSGITALYLLGLTDRIPESGEKRKRRV